jgi:hypothetical protein
VNRVFFNNPFLLPAFGEYTSGAADKPLGPQNPQLLNVSRLLLIGRKEV